MTPDQLAAAAAILDRAYPPAGPGAALGNCGMADHCPDTYSNSNYGLLACLVERVAGQPFPDYLREQLFLPLGMNDTYCSVTGDDHPRRAYRYGWAAERLAEPRDIPV